MLVSQEVRQGIANPRSSVQIRYGLEGYLMTEETKRAVDKAQTYYDLYQEIAKLYYFEDRFKFYAEMNEARVSFLQKKQ